MPDEPKQNVGFRAELQTLLNQHSMENGSDTPDWVLSEYLVACLIAYDRAVTMRDAWNESQPAHLDGSVDSSDESSEMHQFDGDERP